MKIVCTGAKGMIGQHLVELLNKKYPEADIVCADLKNKIPIDLTDMRTCMDLCKGADEVYHLAGIKGNPRKSAQKPYDFISPMVRFDANMIEAGRKCKVGKFLYTSSIGVLFPENDYYPSWAKQTGERMIEAMRIQYPETNYCIVRPANVFGPYDNFDNPEAMSLTRFISIAMKGDLEIWGDGSETRDFIHAEDVARAMMLVMYRMPEEAINIGTGIQVSIKEIAEYIADIFEREVLYVPSKQIGDKKREMDVSELYKLRFKLRKPFFKSIEEVCEYAKNLNNNSN